MVQTGDIAHSENPAYAQYTAAGNTAAQNSNIFVSSSTSTTDVQAIDWWMGAPFHAMAMMDPRLTTTGFGSYRNSAYTWSMGAAVNVGQGMYATGRYPVYFPGNLSTEPLTRYSGNETPNPQLACPGYTGLPLFIEVGANVNTAAGAATLLANGAAVANCVIDSTNATFASYLKWRGGVIVFPQQPLQNGVTYTVALTVNSVPYTWSFNVGSIVPPPPPVPAGWTSLKGILSTGPGASSWGATRTDVFAVGGDNGLWQNTWSGTAWGGWTPLGGIITADPGAVSWGTGRIDVFGRGQDGAPYHRYFDGTKWLGWEGLGGGMKYGPGVASMGPQRLDVFITGLDNQFWHNYGDGQHWASWEPLGGILTSSPAVVSWGPNRLDIFARGSDRQMWHLAWAGNHWTSWEPLGGLFNSGAATASCTSGHLDVFAVGGDNGLWQLGFNGSSWSSWKPLGGSWTSKPSAVCRPGTVIIDLFERGPDNAIWTTSSIPAS